MLKKIYFLCLLFIQTTIALLGSTSITLEELGPILQRNANQPFTVNSAMLYANYSGRVTDREKNITSELQSYANFGILFLPTKMHTEYFPRVNNSFPTVTLNAAFSIGNQQYSLQVRQNWASDNNKPSWYSQNSMPKLVHSGSYVTNLGNGDQALNNLGALLPINAQALVSSSVFITVPSRRGVSSQTQDVIRTVRQYAQRGLFVIPDDIRSFFSLSTPGTVQYLTTVFFTNGAFYSVRFYSETFTKATTNQTIIQNRRAFLANHAQHIARVP